MDSPNIPELQMCRQCWLAPHVKRSPYCAECRKERWRINELVGKGLLCQWDPRVIVGGQRVCSRCFTRKPATAEFFGSNKTGRGGLMAACRACETYRSKLKTARARAATASGSLTPRQLARFWAQVERGDGCWRWVGLRNHCGYGIYNGTLAHRVALVLSGAEVPADKWALHKCDNPPCVNPEHLYIGTRGERGGHAKVTEAAVREMRAEYASGAITQAALARRHGLSEGAVANIIRRETWTHVD